MRAVWIVPVITSILIFGIIASGIPVYADDRNPPDYRGVENSILFRWDNSLPNLGGGPLQPDAFVPVPQEPDPFPLFDLDLVLLNHPGNSDGVLFGCISSFQVCQVIIPNFNDDLETKFLRIQVTYINGPTPQQTFLTGFFPDTSSPQCTRVDRVDEPPEAAGEPGYYFEDWVCEPNPAFEQYFMSPSNADITQIVIDTISFDGDEPPLPEPPVISVDIDIKPGSDPNSVNCKSKGDVPFAILSDNTFDATTIPIELVSMSLVGIEPIQVTETHNQLHLEDVNGDGLLDGVLHIKTSDICLFIPEGTPIRSTIQITLTGETTDGQAFEGSDNIVLKGKKILEN